ncbi:MAG: hypothetical protein E6I64_07595 [Chloroflexi bacterium]|nr:MAG: hypothetical protein E6I64_07595 [Chloroflexota bacterium]
MSAHERDRLVSDLRVFSAAGVERAAWGWDQHGERQRERFHSAERSALHAIEQGDRGEQWDDFRKSIFDMTEGGRALVSWQYEHGPVGHKAERAAFGAALGLFARELIPHAEYVALVAAMAEALPWLLPETPPRPYGDTAA